MVLNWAIMSTAGADGVVTLGGSQVPLRFVVQSPGSITYLDENRPNKSCIPESNTGLFHTCKSFNLPWKTCKGHYDSYQHGTADFESGERSSELYPGVAHYIDDTLNISDDYRQRVIDRFGTKEIYYQVGDEDTKFCSQGTCSNSCGSEVTGSNRLQRMQNFIAYLSYLYPQRALPDSIQFGTFHGGHDSNKGFSSPWFILWAFQTTYAPEPPATLPDVWTKYDGTNCFDGRGAKQILVDSFAYQSVTVEGCQEACQMQKRPLCEGFTVRPAKSSQECWFVTDVQVTKCKKEGGFTFYHLTDGSFGWLPGKGGLTFLVSVISALLGCLGCCCCCCPSLLGARYQTYVAKSDVSNIQEAATAEEEMRLLGVH